MPPLGSISTPPLDQFWKSRLQAQDLEQIVGDGHSSKRQDPVAQLDALPASIRESCDTLKQVCPRFARSSTTVRQRGRPANQVSEDQS